MPQNTIIIIDDDPHIREVIRYTLEREELKVLEASNGLEGLQKVEKNKPDIIILDIMMPELNGLEMCKRLRKTNETPILFLSSKDDEIDRLIGFEIGGDDYVTKPFSPRELASRIKVMLKRFCNNNSKKPLDFKVIKQGCLEMNLENFKVSWQGESIPLTTTEFNLLEVFMSKPQRVFTRDNLIEADIFKDIISDRTIDSHIRRLRKKFEGKSENNIIETVHGFGYQLGSCQ